MKSSSIHPVFVTDGILRTLRICRVLTESSGHGDRAHLYTARHPPITEILAPVLSTVPRTVNNAAQTWMADLIYTTDHALNPLMGSSFTS